jgi:hypothetical protein
MNPEWLKRVSRPAVAGIPSTKSLLQPNDPALQSGGRRQRTVVYSQLAENVFDKPLHGTVGNFSRLGFENTQAGKPAASAESDSRNRARMVGLKFTITLLIGFEVRSTNDHSLPIEASTFYPVFCCSNLALRPSRF